MSSTKEREDRENGEEKNICEFGSLDVSDALGSGRRGSGFMLLVHKFLLNGARMSQCPPFCSTCLSFHPSVPTDIFPFFPSLSFFAVSFRFRLIFSSSSISSVNPSFPLSSHLSSESFEAFTDRVITVNNVILSTVVDVFLAFNTVRDF